MLHAAPGTELAIFNGGSIRIDDVIPPGEVTEYDIIRTLPFGEAIVSVPDERAACSCAPSTRAGPTRARAGTCRRPT